MNNNNNSKNEFESGVIYVEAESNPHKFVDNILNAIGYDIDWKFTLNKLRKASEHRSPSLLSAKG